MSLMDTLKKIAHEFSSRHDYIHGSKGKLEDKHERLKQWHPSKDTDEFWRVLGLGGIDLAWLFFCLGKFGMQDVKNGLNTVFLDNVWIKKWEQEKQNQEIKDTDSKFKKFFANLQKTHPTAAARLHMWMLYVLIGAITTGGVKLVQNRDVIKETVKEKITEIKREIEKKKYENTKYDTTDANFVQDFTDTNWEEIVIGCLEFETWRSKPVLQSKEKRCTYGPGLTWVYVDGEQKPCDKEYKDMAAGFSNEQIWDQVKQHCMCPHECLANIRKGANKYAFPEMSHQQILGLFFAGYQTPSRLLDGTVKIKQQGKKVSVPYVGTIHKLSDAGDDMQKIADSFIPGIEINSTWRTGTIKRRWWCAMLYLDKIKIQDFIDMDRDAFSRIEIDSIYQNGHFIFDDATIQYALQCNNPKTGTVRDFIISNHVLDDIETIYVVKNEKVISFNEGISKIKNKQNQFKGYTNYSNDSYSA